MNLSDKILKNIIEKASTAEKDRTMWLDGERTLEAIDEKLKEAVKELKEVIPAKYVSWDDETESQGITWHDVIDKVFRKDLI